MSNVPFTLSTATGSGNVQATYAANLYDGSIVADWVNGALCSTYPPGGAGWPPGPASDGPATNPAVIVDFLNAVLWDGTGGPSIDIANRQAYDSSSAMAVDWGNRLLVGGDGSTTVVDFTSQAGARTVMAFPSVTFADYTDQSNTGSGAYVIWSYTFAGAIPSASWTVIGTTIAFDLAVDLKSTASTKEVSITLGGTAVYDTGALTVDTDSVLAIHGVATVTSVSGITVGFRSVTTASSSGVSLSAANQVQYSNYSVTFGIGGNLILRVTGTVGSGGSAPDMTGRLTRVTLAPPASNY